MYSTIATIRYSGSLMLRCTAGVSSEVSAGTTPGNTAVVESWINMRAWDLASTPGWAASWESAEANGIVDPGADEGVITDGMILSRLQPLLVQYPLDDLEIPPIT